MSSILGSLSSRRVEDERPAQELAYARSHWPEVALSDLDHLGGRRWADRASGLLHEEIVATVLHGKYAQNPASDAVSLFFCRSDGGLVFLQRPERGPQTVAELAEQDAVKARRQAEAGQAHARFVASQPLRPLTLVELDGEESLPTLREAAELVYGLGGRLEARDGCLVVLIPAKLNAEPFADLEARNSLRRAARVLVVAQNLLLAELARGSKKPLAERLPDRQVLAAGGVEP